MNYMHQRFPGTISQNSTLLAIPSMLPTLTHEVRRLKNINSENPGLLSSKFTPPPPLCLLFPKLIHEDEVHGRITSSFNIATKKRNTTQMQTLRLHLGNALVSSKWQAEHRTSNKMTAKIYTSHQCVIFVVRSCRLVVTANVTTFISVPHLAQSHQRTRAVVSVSHCKVKCPST